MKSDVEFELSEEIPQDTAGYDSEANLDSAFDNENLLAENTSESLAMEMSDETGRDEYNGINDPDPYDFSEEELTDVATEQDENDLTDENDPDPYDLSEEELTDDATEPDENDLTDENDPNPYDLSEEELTDIATEENENGTEEISEGTESYSMPNDTESENNADNSEDEQGEMEEALAEVSDAQPDSPFYPEVSAYDQLADYFSSHNYGPQDYAEYSKDPEWQELNNAFLQELGREPIDYSGGETSDITDIRDELIAAGIPENSPELDAILANEQEGIENIQDLDSPAESSIDGETDATYDEPPLDNSEPQITDSEIDEEVEGNPQTGSEDISSDITSDEQLDVASDLPVMTPREYDDFERSVLEGKPDFYESGSFYEQGINEFGYQGTCGPTSQANALNELFDTNEFTENKVLNVAVDNNLCSMDSSPENCGGTTTEQFMELYDKMNEQLDGKINTELYEFNNALDVEDVASKLDEGCVLNVAVDASALWDQPREYVNSMGIPCDDFYSDHWITVTGVQRDELGNIQGFDIIDSGGGVNYVDADKYHEMCFGTDEHRVIDPTAIVVSKNDVPIASDANHDTGDNSNTGDQSNWFQRVFGRRNE